MMELLQDEAGLLVIDFQEKLCQAMDQRAVERAARNVSHLLTLAKRLDLCVIATEQYPSGLGPTIAPLAEHLTKPTLAKTAFSALRDPQAANAIAASGCRQWIVVGMEAHICVYQTARDLIGQGMDTIVPRDAVLSRNAENLETGLTLIGDGGGHISTTETILFDLLKEAGGPIFKEISRLIR